MLLIPAIDLKDGRCVRLRQGDMSDATVFSEDPAEMARHWLDLGARRLHLVDLNGAVSGRPRNEAAVRSIVDEIAGRIPVQLGGGLRDLDTIERYLDNGLSYVIIGTAAVKNPGFLHDACGAFPGQVIVGLDAMAGAGSPGTRSSTWPASSKTMASKGSSTPTSGATACSPGSTSRRRCASPRPCGCR
jgi:phosphoribosylformimino-5-aminoimidazole carboxamide ribotide isomerase